ncbi:MAG TPA: retropepsin-like aspartic protease, partial [Longimicrobiaceae bacterium]|nr:retropepsin-like aspartic protease [Longimicrobiaceae bacterium]
MRSEARALGLRIIPAGIEVGSSTGTEVTADVAVADRLTIGGLEFHNAVFLVMDDSLLTFPDGFRIPGIIGFPVIEAMGEIRIRGGDTLVVPERVPTRTAANLALQQLSPLTTVSWRGDTLICRLDTGASSIQFYEPVYRRSGDRIRAAGRLDTLRFGGAGGVRQLEGYRLRDVRLAVGDATVVLDSTFVLTHSIEDHPEDNFLGCNLGHDVLDAFGEYVINFRDMAFLLR